LKVEASFLRSAASARDLPNDGPAGLAAVAFVGRSNVGKSSLINALVRRTIARASAAPGKTRLANIYRVVRGSAAPIHLIDLPGYGFAKGGTAGFAGIAEAVLERDVAALLIVDARHPGLDNDRDAWTWLRRNVARTAVAATKIDKLARGERIRTMSQFESVFEGFVLPVSAATGEGLDELWKLIDRLVNSPRPSSNSSPSRPHRQPPSRRRAETEPLRSARTTARARPRR
jgi:GTP-binding protein